jgi:hypothetical protein
MSQLTSIPINNIEISCDYETGYRAGAGSTFQVSNVIITTEFGNLKPEFDAGQHYSNLEDVVRDLGFDPAHVNFDEV